MKSPMNILNSRTIGMLLVVLGTLAGAAHAQGVRIDRDATKSSDALKATFKPAVEEARKSTAMVFIDGKQAALATVVDKDGLLVTKASEVAAAKKLNVRVGGNEFAATVVGVSQPQDLAMLKIDAKGLTPANWFDGKKLDVGQWVVSSGTGEAPIAVGVVSVGRRKIAGQSAFLGVGLADSDDKDGAKITQVMPGSAAEKAGVMVDDVITKVGTKDVNGREALVTAIREYRPGDVVPLTAKRGEKTVEMKATLGTMESMASPRFDMQNLLGGPVSKRSTDFPAVFQHDTVIRPADCGGPLVDLDGKVVGINIARAGRTETYAIPADVIIPLIKELASGKLGTKISTPAATTTAPAPATNKN